MKKDTRCKKCAVVDASCAEIWRELDALPNGEGDELIAQLRGLPHTFDCDRCGTHLEVWTPGSDVSCDRCRASFNAFGQRLRDDWFANPAWRGEDMDDLEGLEVSQLLREGA